MARGRALRQRGGYVVAGYGLGGYALGMCHAYSITTSVEALRQAIGAMVPAANIGNLEPQNGVYPGMLAPVIRNQPGFREFVKVMWGMPTPSSILAKAAKKRAETLIAKRGQQISHDEYLEMIRMEPDRGVHNVRNTDSPHWRPWLAPQFRVLVPFRFFAEFDGSPGLGGAKKGNTWFAFDDDRPHAFFAGIMAPQYKTVRRTGEGLITTDLFAFLTTDASSDVSPVNPDSMPVILTTPEELETWMTAPWEEARKLQRPLPPGMLKVVSVGPKEFPPAPVEEPTLF